MMNVYTTLGMVVFLVSLLVPLAASDEFPKKAINPYDEKLAEKMLLVAALGYCSEEQLMSWNCTPCQKLSTVEVKVYKRHNQSDAAGFVGVSHSTKEIIIGFKGSDPDDIHDWLTDFNFRRVPYELNNLNLEVHHGFFNGWTRIAESLLGAFASLNEQHPDYSLKIAGHSMGASIATLCAVSISQNYQKQATVYTFGEPRVGNEAFANFTNRLVPEKYRVVHWRDIVPHSTPMWDGFRHAGIEVWYNDPMDDHKVCEAYTEDETCSNSLWLPSSVHDHVFYFNTEVGDMCLS